VLACLRSTRGPPVNNTLQKKEKECLNHSLWGEEGRGRGGGGGAGRGGWGGADHRLGNVTPHSQCEHRLLPGLWGEEKRIREKRGMPSSRGREGGPPHVSSLLH